MIVALTSCLMMIISKKPLLIHTIQLVWLLKLVQQYHRWGGSSSCINAWWTDLPLGIWATAGWTYDWRRILVLQFPLCKALSLSFKISLSTNHKGNNVQVIFTVKFQTQRFVQSIYNFRDYQSIQVEARELDGEKNTKLVIRIA